MQSILVIEDSPEMQLLIKSILTPRFQLDRASSAEEALSVLERKSFDLILLDVTLTGSKMNGFNLCSHLRSKPETRDIPIMFITASAEIADKLMGFSSGGDDYIVKPFHPLELCARVESRLLRVDRILKSTESILKGDLRINLPLQKVFVKMNEAEEDLNLTPSEFKLLYCLARQEGELVSRNQLLKEIWGDQTHVVDRTVDTHIYTLRRKLGSRAYRIESITGVGYRFSGLKH